MSARFTPKDIHPSIFLQIHDLQEKYMAGNVLNSESNHAISKHFLLWVAERRTGFSLWILSLAPVIAAAGFLPEGTLKGVKVVVALGAIFLWLGIGYLAYLKGKDVITWEELSALRPGLDLNEHQTLYVECLQYVEESKVLDESQKKSWRTVLYNALDQALVLTKLSDEMQTSSGTKNHSENLAEIDRIQSLSEGSTDPIAKSAYQDSLRMAKDRLSKWDSIAVQSERTEAHLELTKQTFLKTRDTLKSMSLQNQQTVQVDLEPLRANLSRVEADAYEIQRAIEELRQI
jgi:hypothetical protein